MTRAKPWTVPVAAVIVICVFFLAPGSATKGATITDFESQSATLVAKLDRDKNGSIDRKEVEQAILDQSIKAPESHTLYALRANYNELAEFSKKQGGEAGVISVKALAQLQKSADKTLVQAITDSMDSASTFLSTVNRDLYPKGTVKESEAKMKNIAQRNRGNCYYLSGIGSLAVIDPQKVKAVIRDNGLNKAGVRTYTVTFPNAPKEPIEVEQFTDVGLLVNDVDADSGVWVSVLVRAYGLHMRAHPEVRPLQRSFFHLDARVLAEDLTDEGSMNSDGLRALADPTKTRVRQHVWGYDHGLVDREVDRFLSGVLDQQFLANCLDNNKAAINGLGLTTDEVLDLFKKINQSPFRKTASKALSKVVLATLEKYVVVPRDEKQVHDELKHAVHDNHLPATVYKSGGAHEASIVGYRPLLKTPDGKHTSKYGFVVVRDQAGLSTEEENKVKAGDWWREADQDDRTVCMSVEEFTSFYNGFACVVLRSFK